MGRKRTRQGVGHVSNEVTILPVFLKTTLTIAIFTLIIADNTGFPSSDVNHLDTENEVFHLNTISADILDSTGSYVARNQRQVLHTIIAGRDAGGNHVIKHLTAATGHTIAGEVLLKHIALDGRADNNSVKILRQQQVTTSTYYNIRRIGLTKNRSYLQSLEGVFELQKTLTHDIKTKRVMRFKTIVTYISHFLDFNA